jgi:adenylate cyclase
MPTEIERKFLVSGDGWKELATGSQLIEQGYFDAANKLMIRARIIDGKSAVITIKTPMIGYARGEYEYPIPLQDARELIAAAGGHVITKRRFEVPFAGKDWVVDVFEEPHAGFTLAEIELESEDETFEPPDWLGREVSDDPSYSNAALSGAMT